MGNGNGKSPETWIWDAACSIRGAKGAPKYKEYILPLIFAKRLCDVFDDEIDRMAKEVGSPAKAFKLVKHYKKLVRFYLPLEPKNPDDPVWSVVRTLSDKIGEQLMTRRDGAVKLSSKDVSVSGQSSWTRRLPEFTFDLCDGNGHPTRQRDMFTSTSISCH